MDTNQEQTRHCTKCGQEKSVSEFRIKDRRTGRLRTQCRDCENEYSLARFHARYVPHPKPKPTERTCTQCGRTLPVEEFPVKSHATGWRRSICRDCKHAQQSEYRASHVEQNRESSREYYRRNREEITERLRRWREEHPDEYREIHSRWKARNKSAVNAATHRRRSNIKGNGGAGWTAEQWDALKAEFDYTCLLCGRQEPDIQLHADHIVPVQLGGTNAIDNIQPLCKSCNSRKHTQILDLRLLWRMTHPKGEPT